MARVGELLLPSQLGKFIDQMIEADKLAALADTLGFDPRLADELVVADYGASTLFLFRVAHDPEVVERRFRERVPVGVTRVVHEARVVRVGGKVGTTQRSLVFLDGQVIALEVGGELLAKAVVGFAEERLHRARPALSVAPLASLAEALAPRDKALKPPPLVMMFPQPNEKGWSHGAHGLLEVTTAVGISASTLSSPSPPSADEQARALSIELVALGAFGEDAGPVRERLVGTVRDVVTSGLGGLLGLDRPIDDHGYTYEVTPERLTVRAAWDTTRLATGLRRITAPTIRDVVGGG